MTERGEDRTQRRGPLRVAGGVEVEQVGEEGRQGVACGIREEGVGIEHRELRVAFHRGGEELVDGEDGLLRTLLRGRAREDAADDDGHLRIVGLERGDDFPEVAPDGVDGHLDLDVIRAHQQHDGLRVERQHILLEPEQHPARRVAADAAVGQFHAFESLLEIRAPALGDRIAEEDDRSLVLGDLRRPLRSDRVPSLHVAVIATQGAFAGQRGLGRGRGQGERRWVGGGQRKD